MTLSALIDLFKAKGCKKLYVKPLAKNDNSKNQVYFGGSFEVLNLFPIGKIIASKNSEKKKAIFKANLKFSWLLGSGNLAESPGAQFILYPQYPEVRFSGFLQGCAHPPSEIMVGREPGRLLFLGTNEQQTIGFAIKADSPIAKEFYSRELRPTVGVFIELPLPNILGDAAAQSRLLGELRRINRQSWIDSKQLDSSGKILPCNAPQCGGFTLEAELGIAKNSRSEPDFHGWEVKQHSVSNFINTTSGTITLMTPEPTGGFYKQGGVEAFIRKFGYADKQGRADRFNFGGVHKTGQRHPLTNLTMVLEGYDPVKGKIIDSNGIIGLINANDELAVSWSFSDLLAHWARKHAKAVYVPSQCRKEPVRQYCYGNKVRLALQTDPLRLLKALASGEVYYDPGIKLENASTKPVTKRRSQFRIASRNIAALYEKVETVEL